MESEVKGEVKGGGERRVEWSEVKGGGEGRVVVLYD